MYWVWLYFFLFLFVNTQYSLQRFGGILQKQNLKVTSLKSESIGICVILKIPSKY